MWRQPKKNQGLSPKTINYACCRNNPRAGEEVSPEIMDDCHYQSKRSVIEYVREG